MGVPVRGAPEPRDLAACRGEDTAAVRAVHDAENGAILCPERLIDSLAGGGVFDRLA